MSLVNVQGDSGAAAPEATNAAAPVAAVRGAAGCRRAGRRRLLLHVSGDIRASCGGRQWVRCARVATVRARHPSVCPAQPPY